MQRIRGFFKSTAVMALCCILCLCFCLRVFAKPQIVYQSASKTGNARVALTFDDGPHPRYTALILDILREYGVVATFFTVGVNVETYPKLIERAVAEGHEIGNHTYNHYHVPKLSDEALYQDIEACSNAVERVTGERPRLFRPPEGVCSDAVKSYCEREGMTIVMWSVDTRDWAHTPINEIYRNIRTNVKNGSIILMHDFIGKNSPTPQALRQVIPMLLELGYEFVTVSELLDDVD